MEGTRCQFLVTLGACETVFTQSFIVEDLVVIWSVDDWWWCRGLAFPTGHYLFTTVLGVLENFVSWTGCLLLKAGLVYVRWLLACTIASVKDGPVIRCSIGSKILDQHLLKVALLALILLHVDLATIVLHRQRVESAWPQSSLSVHTLFVITTGFSYVDSFDFDWLVSWLVSVLLLACFDVPVVLAHLLEGEWAWHIV